MLELDFGAVSPVIEQFEEVSLAAMLNSPPLGFYSPSQLVQDADRHGVGLRPADVTHSDVDCTLEDI